MYAQDSLDCNVNINRAVRYLRYLKSSTHVKADSMKAVKYLEPCVNAKNATAQLLMGRLYLNSNDDKKFKKGFRLTKKAAKQDLPLAAYDLGVLYKYGNGVNQNLKKAANWFRKGYNLGNSKAAYSLGYMFLKGFGGENQDYKKAVKWFKKSDYPMAKHWLAVCYYFGYGVKQNKLKAKRLLEENQIQKSEILLNSLEQFSEVEQLTDQEAYILNKLKDNENNSSENTIEVGKLLGTWTGYLIQLDWSKNSIVQRIPATIQLKKDSISDQFLSETIIGSNLNTSELLVYSDEIKLDNLSLDIKHAYACVTEAIQNYNIVPSKIELINHNNNQFLSFTADSFINGWKEPGAPMVFVLKKEKKLTDNNVEISNEALEALESQTDFIKLYPNPFDNDLVIAYDLENTADVSIKVTSLDGLRSFDVATINQQHSGSYMYYFDGSILQKGMYVINIIYGGERETKIILKN
jgi:hypothetical protein